MFIRCRSLVTWHVQESATFSKGQQAPVSRRPSALSAAAHERTEISTGKPKPTCFQRHQASPAIRCHTLPSLFRWPAEDTHPRRRATRPHARTIVGLPLARTRPRPTAWSRLADSHDARSAGTSQPCCAPATPRPWSSSPRRRG